MDSRLRNDLLMEKRGFLRVEKVALRADSGEVDR
jgi:hypothetical protein